MKLGGSYLPIQYSVCRIDTPQGWLPRTAGLGMTDYLHTVIGLAWGASTVCRSGKKTGLGRMGFARHALLHEQDM